MAFFWPVQLYPNGIPYTLASLSDVSLTSLLNGQYLTWNAGTSKWNNITLPTITAATMSTLGTVFGQTPTGSTANNVYGNYASPPTITGTNNNIIGTRTNVIGSGGFNTLVGDLAGSTITTGSNNTCIGQSSGVSSTTQNSGTAIGDQAIVSANGVSIGDRCSVTGNESVGIGELVNLVGTQSVAIGALAACHTSTTQALALGYNASASNSNTVTIGANTTNSGLDAVCIGNGATCGSAALNGVAIGSSSSESASGGVAINGTVGSSATSGTAINGTVQASANNAVGISGVAWSPFAFTIGGNARGNGTIVLGASSGTNNTSCTNCVVIGNTATVSNGSSGACTDAIVIGSSGAVAQGATSSIAVGKSSSVAINVTNAIALGPSAAVASTHNNSIALGNGSTTTAANQLNVSHNITAITASGLTTDNTASGLNLVSINGSGNIQKLGTGASVQFGTGNLTYGSYTPTASNLTNITSYAFGSGYYTQIGNIVQVNIAFTGTVTASATSGSIQFTLPVASSAPTGGGCLTANVLQLSGATQVIGTNTIVLNFGCNATGGAASFNCVFTYVVN